MTISDPRLRQIRDQLTQRPIGGAQGVSYHLSALLGQGGQGWVYRAGYDEPDGPWVVVKLLRPDVVNDDALARFLREADVLRKLGQSQAPCPSVVRYFDHGIHRCAMSDGEVYALPFTVLEYVHGTNLQEIISGSPGRGMAPGRARRLFRQVARALGMVHAAQIVHRDLKPSNLLITSEAGNEVMKVGDFGLVKRFDVDVKGTVALAGASLGYAPPEQFEMGNRRVSPRTDLFSFAVVLIEALTGRSAFPVGERESAFQVLSRILSGPRPQLAPHAACLSPELADRPELVAALDRELLRATAADPAERHATLRDFWDAVEPTLRTAAGRRSSSSGVMGAVSAPVPASKLDAPPAPGSPRVVSKGALPERATAMTLAPDGGVAFALGRGGLYRFDGQAWKRLPLSGVEPSLVRGLVATPTGEVVLHGDGVLHGVGADGRAQPWAPPDPDISWVSATLAPGELIFVGQSRARRASVLGSLRPGLPLAVTAVEGTERLLAATRLTTGALLACGEAGELVQIGASGPKPIAWGRTGHLLAIAAGADGVAHVVGSGGHALIVTRELEARLEPVQTTRDLHAVGAHGKLVIAGGDDARAVSRADKAWMRVALLPHLGANVRAISVGAGGARIALDDGAVIEARG
ncbi:MAG: serine/threonine protein kinase [Polyangiaceae bacterium]|nr:serine/threonine protein kinase [Polyangiaceae bacterium]